MHIGIKEGETAKADALLAIIGKEGEDISPLLQGKAPKAKSDVQPKEMPQANDNGEAPSVNALPEGVQIITMPPLKRYHEEGTVASWLKKKGDSIAEGDILAEIENDKATMEFESFFAAHCLRLEFEG